MGGHVPGVFYFVSDLLNQFFFVEYIAGSYFKFGLPLQMERPPSSCGCVGPAGVQGVLLRKGIDPKVLEC